MNVEKTVFISYRRTNVAWALAVYQNLTAHGYDVFFDYLSIASGDFEQVILGNIAARAHFILILTPSALERCDEPGDWLRREIEYALDQERNIVPLMLEGFDFGDAAIKSRLTGKLTALARYNALRVPMDFFDEAMARVRDRYLNTPLEMVIHPPTPAAAQAVASAQAEADAAPAVTEQQLTAEEWFERGMKTTDHDEEICCFTEAIRLNPQNAYAYNNRGFARGAKGDLEGEIADYNQAIRLNPQFADAYNNRGTARDDKGDLDGAMTDFDQAIRLNPKYALAYNNRGFTRINKADLNGAIEDCNQALRLDPQLDDAYDTRGVARMRLGDLDGAIADFEEALSLNPRNDQARGNREIVLKEKAKRTKRS